MCILLSIKKSSNYILLCNTVHYNGIVNLKTCKLQTILHYYRFHTKVQGIHLDRHRKMTPQYCNKWLRSSRDFSYTHLHLQITNKIHMFMYVLIVSTASHQNSIKNTTNQYFYIKITYLICTAGLSVCQNLDFT